MAVVAALELDDLRAPGERAREAERAHRRLGARVDEAHQLDARHASQSAAPAPPRAGSARRSSCRGDGLLERVDDRGCAWPRIERPPRADVVDVAVPVHVGELRALAALDEDRAAAHRPERADGRATPPGMRSPASAKSRSDVSRVIRGIPASACARERGSFLPGVDAVGNADASIGRPGERKARMLDERRLDALEALKGVRGRTAASRAASGGREVRHGSASISRRAHLIPSPGQRARSSESPGDIPHRRSGPGTHEGALRRPERGLFPLARRPGAREHVRAFDARDDVAVAVEGMRDVVLDGRQGDDSRGGVWDLGVRSCENVVESLRATPPPRARERTGRRRRRRAAPPPRSIS